MSAFSKKSDPTQMRPKAPTSYQYFSAGVKGRQKTRAAVEAIFEPSGAMNSWGFMSPVMRFNIYAEDERFSECPDIVHQAVSNGWLLRIVYDQSERGLATLVFDEKTKVEWRKTGNRYWYLPLN